MFGYINVDQNELKLKDFERYHAYYCGVCRGLKENCGQRARMTLTYDMTFLAVLLSGLYEAEDREEEHKCITHPFTKKKVIINPYTEYAADMNLMLVYQNLMDDWLDDHNHASFRAARSMEKAYARLAKKYRRQAAAIDGYLLKLHRAEQDSASDIDLAAGLTGKLMQEIFVREEDIWSDDLRRMGFFIGKFIYLMDAYDDVDKDLASGSYNPFRNMAQEEGFEEKAKEILVMMAAEAARAFERLPIIENVDILRNILYCGMWVRYSQIQKNKKDKQNKET